MKLTNEKEVKKWLRQLPLVKKEIELKIEFYKELANDFGRVSVLYKEEYMAKMAMLKKRLDLLMKEVDRLWCLLGENEKLVMTAKYVKGIRWDYIDYHVFYSRRQAIRIHNEAVKKLIGQSVDEQKEV